MTLAYCPCGRIPLLGVIVERRAAGIEDGGTIMSSSKLHKRKLAAALKRMGTTLATHTHSTFKPSGMASKTLEEFKARRAAEKLGIAPPTKTKIAERYELDLDTAQVTKLPLRHSKTR